MAFTEVLRNRKADSGCSGPASGISENSGVPRTKKNLLIVKLMVKHLNVLPRQRQIQMMTFFAIGPRVAPWFFRGGVRPQGSLLAWKLLQRYPARRILPQGQVQPGCSYSVEYRTNLHF